MPWYVPIFLFLPYGTIIAIDGFCSFGKILCNFGTVQNRIKTGEKWWLRLRRGDLKAKRQGEKFPMWRGD